MSGELFYEPSRPCPKCGNPLCATEFRRGHHGQLTGWWGLGQEFGDRMVRHCGRCEHRWYELPLDHDADAERAEQVAWLGTEGENTPESG